MREALVTLSDEELEALGFGELVTHCREAEVRDVEMLEDEGYTCLPQVEVGSRLDGDLLDSLDCVDRWELAGEKADSYLYLLELTATELPESIVEDHADLVGNCDTSLSQQGVMLSLLGSQEAIRDLLRHYQDAGVTPDLCKLGEYSGDEDALEALTDRQVEAISTAYEMGFYDVPREASTKDVAAELGVEPATLSEHLQRAERNVLRRELTT